MSTNTDAKITARISLTKAGEGGPHRYNLYRIAYTLDGSDPRGDARSNKAITVSHQRVSKHAALLTCEMMRVQFERAGYAVEYREAV